jgi:hypothetical protein
MSRGVGVARRRCRRAVTAFAVAAAVTSAAVATATGASAHGPTTHRQVPDEAVDAVAPWHGQEPTARRPDAGWSVLYVGDSIAVDTASALRSGLPGWRVESLTFGGTAPCDWVGPALRGALDRAEPDVVVFSFIGNNGTPCTDGTTGWRLHRRYLAALVSICAAAAPARCVAVGQPALAPWVEPNLPEGEPTATFRREAERGRWGFVDAGASVDDAGGAFDPLNRDADGVHLDASGDAAYGAAIAAYLERAVSSAV